MTNKTSKMLRMRTIIPENHHLTLDVPNEFPSGPVEISFKTLTSLQKNPEQGLIEFLNYLKKNPPKKRKSTTEIDALIKELRSSWDD